MKYILTLILPLTIFNDATAQSNLFYYTTGTEKIYFHTVAGKYNVQYPNGLYVDSIYPGEFLSPEYYKVTDTSDLDSFGSNHIVWPVYFMDDDPDSVEFTIRAEIALLYDDEIAQEEKDYIINNYGLTLVDSSTSSLLYSVDDSIIEKAQAIYETGYVKYCHPNFTGLIQLAAVYPTDPFFSKQYYLHNTGQTINDGNSGTAGADIKAPDAWGITTGNSNIVVAVIDNGVEENHPDLPSSRQIRVTGSNLVPYIHGPNDPDKPDPDCTKPRCGHGTQCAGIIAATHNNEGIAGLCPACKIMPFRVAQGFGDIIYSQSTDLAVANNANIISISLYDPSSGSPNRIQSWATSIENAVKANKVVCICAGNTAERDAANVGFVAFPASVESEGVIAIAASNRYDQVANYSPNGIKIDIAAPSTHASADDISGEAHDIWTLDVSGYQGSNRWPSLSGFSYPLANEELPSSGTNYLSYTGRFAGTSASAPQVAGVAALMLSANPCLGNKQVKDILMFTADRVGGYSYWPTSAYEAPSGKAYRPYHNQMLGHGRLNAYRAVKNAQDAYKSTLDLYMKDHLDDFGVEPSAGGENSPDIWVRTNSDGLTHKVHQSQVLTSNRTIYIYVRIRNKSCVDFTTSSELQVLELYYSQSATWTSWPNTSQWQQIASYQLKNITIPAGGDAIVEIPWTIPQSANLQDNKNICLLAQMKGLQHVGDAVLIASPGRLDQYVKKQNNVTMKNFTVIDLSAPSENPFPEIMNEFATAGIGKSVKVGNPMENEETYDFLFGIPEYDDPGATDITEEAEVKLIFDSVGFNLFDAAGAFNQQGVTVKEGYQVVVTTPEVRFSDITFPAETQVPVYISFGFWADEQSENEVFEYCVKQYYHSVPDTPIGSQNYAVLKESRTSFTADAGEDVEINNGGSTTLYADNIGESAYYHWYNGIGELVGTGTSINVSPTISTEYTLEVVAQVDGFKDYDQVGVNVKQYFITSMSPNPADNQLTVYYEASQATTASLMIVPISGGTPDYYSINVNEHSKVIDVSGYSSGNYSVILVCDGNVEDSENLLIN